MIVDFFPPASLVYGSSTVCLQTGFDYRPDFYCCLNAFQLGDVIRAGHCVLFSQLTNLLTNMGL